MSLSRCPWVFADPCLDRLWTRHSPYRHLLPPTMGILEVISPSSESCCIKCPMNTEYNCTTLPIWQPSCWSEIMNLLQALQRQLRKEARSHFLLVAYVSHFWNHGFIIRPLPPQILKVFSSVSVEWETLIRQSTTWGRMWRVPTLVMTCRPGITGTLKTEKEALLCMD